MKRYVLALTAVVSFATPALAQNHTTYSPPLGQQPSAPTAGVYPQSAPYSGVVNSYNAATSALTGINNGTPSGVYGLPPSAVSDGNQ